MTEPPNNYHPHTVESRVIRSLRDRGAAGLAKYGTTMDRKDLHLGEWAKHLQEELLDGAQYAQRVIDAAHLLAEARAIMVALTAERGWEVAERWVAAYDEQFKTR